MKEYIPHRHTENPAPAARDSDSPQPSMEALRTGAAVPSRAQMGRRVDLPGAILEKMESAFGADLSAVRLYESQAVDDAGAQAITRGASIAFAPGLLDFSSFGGQALLGHELSHVVSQARGEVPRSGGFLSDGEVETRSDREGAMAAAGQQIAMPSTALTTVSAAGAAGPMQASKKKSETAVPRQETDDVQSALGTPEDFVRSMGSSNMRAGSRYDRMMGSLEVLNQLQGMKGSLGTDNADYMLPAYARAIADMKKYRKELNGVRDKDERHRQRGVVDAVLRQAKADEKRIRAARKAGGTEGRSASGITSDARSVVMNDEHFVDMNGGAINQVYQYNEGYYKPTDRTLFDYSKDSMSGLSTAEQKKREGEYFVFKASGVRYGRDEKDGIIDTHMDNRELAAARLDKLLGGNVIVDSRRARVDKDSSLKGIERTGDDGETRTFRAEGTQGILMDEAKGADYDQYNWSFVKPVFGGETGDSKWMERDKENTTTVGDRLRARDDFQGLAVGQVDAKLDKGRKQAAGTLNASDPKLQRDMNALFLEDLLMAHADRHAGNFKVEAKDGRVAGVKGIDNDSAFGERTNLDEVFNENGGLPERMHIDRAMANRIRAVDGKQLEFLFSDLLTGDEINAMKSRFKTMSAYIDEMEKQGLLVDRWDDRTAAEQFMMNKGTRDAEKKGGNTYYQGMVMRMNNRLRFKDATYR